MVVFGIQLFDFNLVIGSVQDRKVVVVGGGTGTYALLRALKKRTDTVCTLLVSNGVGLGHVDVLIMIR